MIEFTQLDQQTLKNISELKEGINSYVDKYNNRRFHSSIGYKKPMDVYFPIS